MSRGTAVKPCSRMSESLDEAMLVEGRLDISELVKETGFRASFMRRTR